MIKLEYVVITEGERPLLKTKILDHSIDFSTEVKVFFDRRASAEKCVEYGKNSLKYYPCNIQINGKRYQSIWDRANGREAFFFHKDHCNGFKKTGNRYRSVTILCKYEFISELPLRYLITGGYKMHHNLDDYHSTETPLVLGIDMLLNCNNLSITISRDSFYMDNNHKSLIEDMNESLMEFMDQQFADLSDEVIMANLYILRNQIKSYWTKLAEMDGFVSPYESLFEKFLNRKLFLVNGKKETFFFIRLTGN